MIMSERCPDKEEDSPTPLVKSARCSTYAMMQGTARDAWESWRMECAKLFDALLVSFVFNRPRRPSASVQHPTQTLPSPCQTHFTSLHSPGGSPSAHVPLGKPPNFNLRPLIRPSLDIPSFASALLSAVLCIYSNPLKICLPLRLLVSPRL